MNSPLYLDYADETQRPESPAGEGKGLSRGWRTLGWTSVALSGVLVAGSISAYGYARYIDSGIKRVPVDKSILTQVPKLNEAVNILLLGSDSRKGGNAKYGRSLVDETPRADTTILLHLSPGGEQAVGISFPRDLMVEIPSCTTPDGTKSPVQMGMINSAFSIGGMMCTWKTIQHVTNIHVDHTVVVDFNGFKGVVNAVGGVKICLTEDVNDPKSKLNLKKGTHNVRGEQALAYVRARYGFKDGSDLNRVKRQQQFLGSLAKKALSQDVLSNPGTLNALLRSLTKTVTVDEDFTFNKMTDLAGKLKGISPSKIRFITAPYTAYAPDPNRVALREPEAGEFFAQIANDTQIEDPTKKKVTDVPPAEINVRVLNGSGFDGAAGRVGEALTAKGYRILSVGNPKKNPPSTQILYGQGAEDAATTLATLIPGAKVIPGAKTAAGVVDLVLGPDWTGQLKSSIPKKMDGEVKATDNICKTT
ncbi:LCP family protein [Actinocorallia populi]|uniref:LCP family protein n=1 Tax=Actinocorallia populi TaxID=2079200 RepID=UPI000D08CCF0|nr:LCP family protein [Actinocorallia populi]